MDDVLTLTQQGIEILQLVFGEAFFVVARFTRSERLMVKLPLGRRTFHEVFSASTSSHVLVSFRFTISLHCVKETEGARRTQCWTAKEVRVTRRVAVRLVVQEGLPPPCPGLMYSRRHGL